MLVLFFFTSLGLGMLLISGEAVVRSAIVLAQRLRVPLIIVSITFVAIGTSLPELVVALAAVLKGAPDIAVGNVIGSNIANILLILGAAALVAPLPTYQQGVNHNAWVMLAASIALLGLLWWGEISRWMGAVLVGAGGLHLWTLLRDARRDSDTSALMDDTDLPQWAQHMVIIFLLFALGVAGLSYGTNLFLEGATGLALYFGISEAAIGLGLVAIGTSLPEFVVVVLATIKGKASIAIGNVFGSNIANVVWVLGLTALIVPVPLDGALFWINGWVALICAVLGVTLVYRTRAILRWEGLLLLMAYAVWVVSIYT